MKTVPLTPNSIPEIETAIKARRSFTLELKGKPVAKVQPIVTVTPEEAARILREISESDKGDDWAEYVSW
jgi:galactose-1-phosphate uridylyltransferase